MSIFSPRLRIRSLTILTMLTVAVSTPTYVKSAEYRELGALGRWQLTKALGFGDITSLDEREARQLVGKVFTIDKDHVKFGKRDCGTPELTADIVDPTWFMREYARASSAQLHLSEPVAVVHLACTFAFIKDPDHMILHWKGWFFDAKRVIK
jgi:hypothetical protein